MAVGADSWSTVMDLEYLRLFVPASGSAVKFAIGDDAMLAEVSDRLAAQAGDREISLRPGRRCQHEAAPDTGFLLCIIAGD